jgi:hypothetical protein
LVLLSLPQAEEFLVVLWFPQWLNVSFEWHQMVARLVFKKQLADFTQMVEQSVEPKLQDY